MTQTNTTQNKEELEEKQIAIVKRFIIGMLGQYGRKWEEFTELQQATFEQDIEKLTNGIIHEVCSKSRSQAHQSGIEERDRAIYGILAVIENQLQDTSFGENPTEIVETVLTVIRQEMEKPHEQLLKELDEAPDV